MNERQQLLIDFIARKCNIDSSKIRPTSITGWATDDIITDFAITHSIALKRIPLRGNITVQELLDQLV